MRRVLALALVLGMAGLHGVAVVKAPETTSQVVQAADERWLQLVDAGQYDESWKQASTLFQARVTEAQWASMVKAAREPLGAVRSRVPESATETKTLPGAPDGDYMTTVFATTFAHKGSARETVVAVREKDRSWRVSGYFVR